MKNHRYGVSFALVVGFACLPAGVPVFAEVAQTSATGFQVRHEQQLSMSAEDAFRCFVKDFSKWYDARHSYSQDAANLSLDIERSCMYERLPDGGFVRHMEIVYYQPGKVIRLSGGLGPLQAMGVSGAMTFQFANSDGGTRVTLLYNVSGAEFLHLQKIAVPVDQVLGSQMQRFADFCARQSGGPERK